MDISRQFPPFDLAHLLQTIFQPKEKEKLCILIDLDNPAEVVDFAFTKNDAFPVQQKAYDVFFQGLQSGVMKQLNLECCDLFAYETTGGSNLELPSVATAPSGIVHDIEDIYSSYDIVLCVSTYSATAPLTAAAKKHKFRGATLHGLNEIIVQTGLSVDYNAVSSEAERLRLGMTRAERIAIDFEVENLHLQLVIELGGQEAQKSHGLCHRAPDIVNLPAGEVYFVPVDAEGSFPMKFEEGTLACFHVEKGRVVKATLIRGDSEIIDQFQAKLDEDPAIGILGEIGFGTQILPWSGSDIQDEKIFGTFHLATGRNDHLDGVVTKDHFSNPRNATHEDILFSSAKTPEVQVKQVRITRSSQDVVLIENYEPTAYLWNLRKAPGVKYEFSKCIL
jgi:aminopeptidase